MPLMSGLSMTVVMPDAKFVIGGNSQTSSKLIGSQNPGGRSGKGVAAVFWVDSGPSPVLQAASASAGRMKVRMRNLRMIDSACMSLALCVNI